MSAPFNTTEELMYIDNIGKTHLRTKNIPRKELLVKYFEANLRRDKWDDRDKFKILAYIQNSIASC